MEVGKPKLHSCNSTNWVERFNRQIKKAVSYKAALPSVESALYLIGLVALNATYLHRKIGNLSDGLTKNGESSSGAASPRTDANPPGVFHVRLTDEQNNEIVNFDSKINFNYTLLGILPKNFDRSA